MKTETLTTRIDNNTKIAFTHICDEIGLRPSLVIKLFVKAVINYGDIPFELKVNAQTQRQSQRCKSSKVGKEKIS